MTSESGIEAAVRFVRNGRTNTAITSIQDEAAQVRAIVTGAIQAYLPFHPPASREEGLRDERDDIIIAWLRQRGFTALADEAEKTFQPAALIPTKPEAKEPTAPEPPTGEEELAWEAYVAKFDDSSYGKPTSTDFWPWLKHRRALESKKPE